MEQVKELIVTVEKLPASDKNSFKMNETKSFPLKEGEKIIWGRKLDMAKNKGKK